jgi:anti-sigma factor RsiW
MTCTKSAKWLQIYIDGRLERVRLAHLEAHLAACDACRRELAILEQIRDCASERELLPEPADLTQRILYRIAAYEARRALPAGAEPLGSGVGIPRWVTSWRGALAAIVILMALALLQPGAVASAMDTLSRQAESAYILLLTPGPDSISWAVWVVACLATLFLAVWFIRADASSAWRRAISERLPQLW